MRFHSRKPDENATACINYTSGTTARPKGVQITHRNIWTNAVTFAMHAGVTDRDVYLHTLPMFHANGWGMPFAMTGLGVKQVVIRKIDGAEILRRVQEHGVTVMCAAPAVAARLLQRLRAPLPTLSLRELEVLGLVGEGCSNTQIAQRLHVTEAAVKSHLVHVFTKLGVSSRTAAVAEARRSGMLE